MKLINQIKADQLTARKMHKEVTVSLLTTLIGEVEMVAKNALRQVTNEDVVATIKKFTKNIDITASVVKEQYQLDKCILEKQILELYLPKQLTESELRDIINILKSIHGSNVGAIMKELKLAYTGLYDGKLASELCKGN
jgi:uncharacterized protein YqeY